MRPHSNNPQTVGLTECFARRPGAAFSVMRQFTRRNWVAAGRTVEHGGKGRGLAHVFGKAREHATNAVIGGSILVLTGFTPEHWVAEAFHKLHLPADALSVWPASLGFRLVVVSIVIAIIVGDSLWRRHRTTAAGARVDDSDNAAKPSQSLAAMSPIDSPAEKLPLPSKPSIVVLPFDNLSKDASEDYFTDGMTEEVTTALAR